MKFLILVWCLVFTFYKNTANSLACSIELAKYQPTAIGLRSFGDNFIISNLENTSEISSTRSIFLYCESFRYGEHKLSNSDHEVYCNKQGRLTISIGETWDHYYDSYLKCENELSFYSVESKYCNHQTLAFGAKIRNVTVVLAEVCYNFDNMNLEYLHYTTSKRSTLLNKQIDHNPNSANVGEKIAKDKFTFDYQNNFAINIKNKLKIQKPQVKLIDYELGELVAATNFNKILTNLNQENDLPQVPWWKPLKFGNWITYQENLKTYTRNQNFSVFTGTSHKVSYPDNFLCSADVDLTYEIKSEENNIPLYIWSYVKMRNETNNPNDVVIIGLNTPFFEPSLILCTDICSDIAWLEELEVTRKMQAFGYIFCCDPDEVGTILDGFPKKVSFSDNKLKPNI